MKTIYTIGVYNSTEISYFEKLVVNKIDLFCDIRQRRGVRGSQYKYVNSNYLQNTLNNLGITYWYVKELAPTAEIREKQKRVDKLNNVTKRCRNTLGDVFSNEYCKSILDVFDIRRFVNEIDSNNFQNIVFFCVEENASACHRSLVAQRISEITGWKIVNL